MPLERICQTCLSYMYLHELKGWLKCPSCGFMKREKKSLTPEEKAEIEKAEKKDS